MRATGSFKVIYFLFVCLITFKAFALNDKVIYGEDNRVDVYASSNNLFVELARSTAAMIPPSSMRSSNDTFVLTASSLERRGMCSTERFAKQITAARCSGFLVGEDLLVTAGHCVKSASDCDNYNWVFDYKMEGPLKVSVEVDAENVYKCKEIIERAQDSSGNDYALIRLARAVKDRTPLTFRQAGKIDIGAELVVIGHPTGLPTKISDGAWVRANGNVKYFVANLDTYGGNSGSAVFDTASGTVEGILVRGETDYVYDSSRGCRVSNRCSNTGCRGEDVTRITNIKALMEL